MFRRNRLINNLIKANSDLAIKLGIESKRVLLMTNAFEQAIDELEEFLGSNNSRIKLYRTFIPGS